MRGGDGEVGRTGWGWGGGVSSGIAIADVSSVIPFSLG